MADGAALPLVTHELRQGVDLGDGRLVDLLGIRAPTVLAGLEATRETWSRYALRVLDAPKGGGKTYALARVVGDRAVCVSDRKALAGQMSKGFKDELRREPGSSSRAIHTQATGAARYICTLHTTPRLDARDMRADTLVVDEAIHVLGTLATGAELRGARRGVVYDGFLSAIRRCGEAWFAQAGWGPDDVGALLQTTAAAGRHGRVLVVVVRTPETRGVATEAPNVEALRAGALVAAAQGPVVYTSTSRKSGERLQQEAIGLGMDPLVVSGRTLHSLRVQRWFAAPRAEVEPFVILSPTVVSGLSIDRRTDGSPAYPHVFMEFCTWPGGLALDDGLQIVPSHEFHPPHHPLVPHPAPSSQAHLPVDALGTAAMRGCRPGQQSPDRGHGGVGGHRGVREPRGWGVALRRGASRPWVAQARLEAAPAGGPHGQWRDDGDRPPPALAAPRDDDHAAGPKP